MKRHPFFQFLKEMAGKVTHRPKAGVSPPDGRWRVMNGDIYLNGKPMKDIMQDMEGRAAQEWSQLSIDLSQFLTYYVRRNAHITKKVVNGKIVEELNDPTGELGFVSALVDAYIAKIARKIKKKYDAATDGLSFVLDENGQLVINGMNVGAFIEMAKDYPSDKAKIFLSGLKTRLGVILANKSGNANYEKIREITYGLFSEIDSELLKLDQKK